MHPLGVVDSIVCINLQERRDRFERSQKVFDALQLPVHYYRPQRHPQGGTVGCFTSHLAVVEQAFQRGAKQVLVFEDDIVATPAAFSPRLAQAILDFAHTFPEVEYIQLGYSILPHEALSFFTAPRPAHHMLSYNGNLAHAYLLTRPGMKTALDAARTLPSHAATTTDIDLFYKDLFQRRCTGFSVIPQLFQQDFCDPSNNATATSPYYAALRNVSCFSTQSGLFYRMSVVRVYLVWIVVWGVISALLVNQCALYLRR